MAETEVAEEGREVEVHGGGGRTVVVGVKLDSPSKELLTWALVKVAQPGDRVIALHVLNNNEIKVDRDSKSCLLSTVNAFNSVLSVYEGFCNLKQVDLKLKFCRGSSIRKVLVRQTKSYSAAAVVVGISQNHHAIHSSASVAKYCAKKLPKHCSILAVDNEKVVFHREVSLLTDGLAKEINYNHQHSLLGAIQRTLGKNSKERPTIKKGLDTRGTLDLALGKAVSACKESTTKKKCSVCSRNYVSENSAVKNMEESSSDSDESNSMALEAVQSVDAASSTLSLSIGKLPEYKPCWPLLRQDSLSDRWPSNREHQFAEVDGENGAPIPIIDENFAEPSSPSSSSSLPEELEGLLEKYSATCRLFTYQELLQATSNFMPENFIGKGGSSDVYRGYLPDGKELAVKNLKPSEDALKEFVTEIEIITALNHKNILSLFGFCFEGGNLLLVYDFLSKGSVEENLHGNTKVPRVFGWTERFKVAIGVAEALVYLHKLSAKPVIHRDVKSSNILLSDDYEPQLSDFGLAKWAATSSSHMTCTVVAGTFGYLAPEYFMYGKVNDKIDVYAFGVVLLELLSGRKPISNEHPKGQESLVMWAKPILNGGKATELLDPSLANCYDGEQMERMVLAAMLCIRRAPRGRPHMSTVLKLLQGDTEVMEWARLQENNSGGIDVVDEAFRRLNLQSHLNLALLDVEDDSLSVSSIEQSISLEDYLQGRRSRSSSLD